MDINSLKFSALSQESKVKGFDCNFDDITSFLQDDALDYQNQKIANTYIFKDKDEDIVAFFSLSNDCLNDKGDRKGFSNLIWNRLHREIRLPNAKRIRYYPSIKIGRLGVHKNYQGTGLAYQLMDFIKGWVATDHKPACRLLILDAVNQSKQIKYYNRNDFKFLLLLDADSHTRMMYFDLLQLYKDR